MPLAQGTYFLYTVQPGDTLYSIGVRLSSTVQQIEQLNALYQPFTDPGMIFPGQLLLIQYRYNLADQTFYFIRSGDYLYSIANQFNTDVQSLLSMNPQIQNPNIIYPNQLLKVPVQIYLVAPGDTLFNIAKRLGVSVDTILNANRGRPGLSPDVLFPGYGLVIPSIAENDQSNPIERLAALLPNSPGFTWIYHGFAEYSHMMTLQSIDKQPNRYVYNITGMVDDPSGGEAVGRDFSLTIQYIIENGTLIQLKREQAMMDSPFDRIELIRLPLTQGNTWTQQVTDPQGQVLALESTIESVRDESGSKVYTVYYRLRGNDYYEKREIKEGIGVISFEKLLVLEDQSFPVEYRLYEEMSGPR